MASVPYNTTTPNSGAITIPYQDGNTLDNCTIGATTAAPATVTNLTVTGTLTRSGGQVSAPITVTGTTLALTAATHGGRTVVQDAAAGSTVSLPAATGTGVTFKVVVATTITSNGLIVNTAGTDVFAGGVLVAKTSDGTSFAGDSTANKTLTFNGTTTGGIAGSYVTVTDIKAGKWLVEGFAPASGTLATPFSN